MTASELAASRIQASLPVSLSGFGLRSMARAAPCATLSVLNTHAAAIRLLFAGAGLHGAAYDPLALMASHVAWAQLAILGTCPTYDTALFSSSCQKQLARAQELLTLSALMDAFIAGSSLADAARLVSLSGVVCPATYGWLIVCPNNWYCGLPASAFCTFFHL